MIGVRAQIAENVTVRNSYIIGADMYEQARAPRRQRPRSRPNIGVGSGSVIENAMIDKNARIGRGVKIVNEAGVVDSEEAPHYVIRDEIVVIPKLHDPSGSAGHLIRGRAALGAVETVLLFRSYGPAVTNASPGRIHHDAMAE